MRAATPPRRRLHRAGAVAAPRSGVNLASLRDQAPLSVAAWMAQCNAHYYATRDPLGAAGDFTTAPEISQMFGELVGAALATCWIDAGGPENAIYAQLG